MFLTQTKTKAENNRMNQRVKLEWPAWVRNGNSTFQKVPMLNVSDDGVAIQWNNGNVGGDVDLILKLDDGHYHSFRAKTAWQAGEQSGLKSLRSCRSQSLHLLQVSLSWQSRGRDDDLLLSESEPFDDGVPFSELGSNLVEWFLPTEYAG